MWFTPFQKKIINPGVYVVQVPAIVDTVQEKLLTLSSDGSDSFPPEQLKEFKKRKLINNMSVPSHVSSGHIACG